MDAQEAATRRSLAISLTEVASQCWRAAAEINAALLRHDLKVKVREDEPLYVSQQTLNRTSNREIRRAAKDMRDLLLTLARQYPEVIEPE